MVSKPVGNIVYTPEMKVYCMNEERGSQGSVTWPIIIQESVFHDDTYAIINSSLEELIINVYDNTIRSCLKFIEK